MLCVATTGRCKPIPLTTLWLLVERAVVAVLAAVAVLVVY
jgi:hypothetical protein